MFNKIEKETLISSLRYRLLSTSNQEEKDQIQKLIVKLKRQNTSRFLTRKELADHFGISHWKLIKDINSNQSLIAELTSTGWNPKKDGFYPRHLSIVFKHFGI